MRQNIAIALITMSLLLLGVLLGGVTMLVGMLVHEASVLVVIANAMRLLRQHTPKTHAARSTRAADRPANGASVDRRIPREEVRLPRQV